MRSVKGPRTDRPGLRVTREYVADCADTDRLDKILSNQKTETRPARKRETSEHTAMRCIASPLLVYCHSSDSTGRALC